MDVYPVPFHTADLKANRARDVGRVLVAGSLVAGVAAAGLEIIDWKSGNTDWAAFASACAFALAFGFGGLLALLRPERRWHALRAVAEALRGIAWQHALGQPPYEGADADAQLQAHVGELRAEAAQFGVSADGNSAQYDLHLTGDHAARVAAYATRRVGGQLEYYTEKARAHGNAHLIWIITALIFQLGGLAAALARAFWQFDTDLLGLAATAAAAATAWTRARDHAELADVYRQTASALEAEAARLDVPGPDVGEVIGRIEALLAGEHARWLARRRVLGLSAG